MVKRTVMEIPLLNKDDYRYEGVFDLSAGGKSLEYWDFREILLQTNMQMPFINYVYEECWIYFQLNNRKPVLIADGAFGASLLALLKSRFPYLPVGLHNTKRIGRDSGVVKIGRSFSGLTASMMIEANHLYVVVDDVVSTGGTLKAIHEDILGVDPLASCVGEFVLLDRGI